MLDDKYASKFKHVILTIKLLCIDIHVNKPFFSPRTGEEHVPAVCLYNSKTKSSEGAENHIITVSDSQPFLEPAFHINEFL